MIGLRQNDILCLVFSTGTTACSINAEEDFAELDSRFSKRCRSEKWGPCNESWPALNNHIFSVAFNWGFQFGWEFVITALNTLLALSSSCHVMYSSQMLLPDETGLGKSLRYEQQFPLSVFGYAVICLWGRVTFWVRMAVNKNGNWCEVVLCRACFTLGCFACAWLIACRIQ